MTTTLGDSLCGHGNVSSRSTQRWLSLVPHFLVENISSYYAKRIRIIDICRRFIEQSQAASCLLPGILFVANRAYPTFANKSRVSTFLTDFRGYVYFEVCNCDGRSYVY